MYLVVNQTKRIVTINDLNCTIPAGTMLDIDIHKRNKYLRAEDSKDLVLACRTGILKTMKTDSSSKKKEVAQPVKEPNVDMSDIMGQLKGLIQDEFKKIQDDKPEPTPAPVPEPKSNDMSEMMISMMKDIKNSISTGGVRMSDLPMGTDDFADDGIDEEKLLAIHSAAMKKMKDKRVTKSEISYDVTVVKDTELSDNLDDLEGLM